MSERQGGPGPRPTLRECARSDLDAVLALWRDAEAVVSPTDHIEALERRLAHADGLFRVAEADGRLVGTVIGGWDGWRGSLYRVAVHPDWRRRGVATALVRDVEARLVRLGARRITLRVFHEQPGAVELWERLGCAAVREESIYAKTVELEPR